MGTTSSFLNSCASPIEFNKGSVVLTPPDNRLARIGIYYMHIVNTEKMIELVDQWEDLINRYQDPSKAIELFLVDSQKGPKIKKLIQKGPPAKFR